MRILRININKGHILLVTDSGKDQSEQVFEILWSTVHGTKPSIRDTETNEEVSGDMYVIIIESLARYTEQAVEHERASLRRRVASLKTQYDLSESLKLNIVNDKNVKGLQVKYSKDGDLSAGFIQSRAEIKNLIEALQSLL